MLESNLLKIIQPYSSVELRYVATAINLPEPQVITKLSQMVLDRKFFGILDQGRGHLLVYDSAPDDTSFSRGERTGQEGVNNYSLTHSLLLLLTRPTVAVTVQQCKISNNLPYCTNNETTVTYLTTTCCYCVD